MMGEEKRDIKRILEDLEKFDLDHEEKDEVKKEGAGKLRDQLSDIKQLLDVLEDEYRRATISEKTFREATSKNKAKMKEIEEKLAEMEGDGKLETPTPAKPGQEIPLIRRSETPSPPTETETPPEEGVITQSMEGLTEDFPEEETQQDFYESAPTETADKSSEKTYIEEAAMNTEEPPQIGVKGKMIKFLNKLKSEDKKGDKKKKEEKEEDKSKGDEKEEKKEEKKKEESPPPAPSSPAPSSPAPQPQYPYMFPFFQPPGGKAEDGRKFEIEFEKTKATLDSFKESMKDTDEKIRGFAESLGEIRSMFFQREQSIKTMEDKIDKMADVVESLEPSKLAEESARQEKDKSVMEAKLERLDKITSDLLNRFAEIRETLEGIKNLKAIVDMSRDVGQKLVKIEEIGSTMDQMSTKLENTYLEMNKHLSDIPIMKTKVESMERSTRDMMKMIDETKISLEKVPSVEDVRRLASPETPAPMPVVTGDIEELKKKRNELKQLLDTLENEYKNSAISEESYKESSEKSKEKLKEIEDKIDALESVTKSGGGFTGKLKSIFSRKKEEAPPAETEAPPEEGIITQSMEVVPEEETPEGEAKEAVVGMIKKKEIEQVVQPKSETPKPSAKANKKTGLKKKIDVKKEEKERKDVDSMSTSDKRKELLDKLKMR